MPKEGISQVHHDDILTIEEIGKIARIFTSLGVDKVRLTGGEPLVRKGIVDLVKRIGQLEDIKDFAMTTNGILLRKYARDLKKAGLNRVNISLDTLNENKYAEITRGGRLSNVLRGIEVAKEEGLTPIKINTVLVGGFNDDEIEDFIRWTEEEQIDVRFIELMPMGEAVGFNSKYFISNQLVLDKVPTLIKVERVDKSSPAIYYRVPNGKGRVGLINPISCKFCEDCNRVRITAQGKLKLCLHSNEEIDLKEALMNGGDIENVILNAIKEKPESHHLEDGKYIWKDMYRIGG